MAMSLSACRSVGLSVCRRERFTCGTATCYLWRAMCFRDRACGSSDSCTWPLIRTMTVLVDEIQSWQAARGRGREREMQSHLCRSAHSQSEIYVYLTWSLPGNSLSSVVRLLNSVSNRSPLLWLNSTTHVSINIRLFSISLAIFVGFVRIVRDSLSPLSGRGLKKRSSMNRVSLILRI